MSNILNYIMFFSLILLLPTAYAGLIGAPFVPTRKKIIDKALAELPVSQGDLVIDLGSGDGAVLIAAARRGARAIGYELSPIMWFVAWFRAALFYGKARYRERQARSSQRPRLPFATIKPSIKFGNFYHLSLPPETTVVFAFLMPKTMPRLKEYLNKQHLPKLRYVLCSTFPLPSEKPFQVVEVEKLGRIYIYKNV